MLKQIISGFVFVQIFALSSVLAKPAPPIATEQDQAAQNVVMDDRRTKYFSSGRPKSINYVFEVIDEQTFKTTRYVSIPNQTPSFTTRTWNTNSKKDSKKSLDLLRAANSELTSYGAGNTEYKFFINDKYVFLTRTAKVFVDGKEILLEDISAISREDPFVSWNRVTLGNTFLISVTHYFLPGADIDPEEIPLSDAPKTVKNYKEMKDFIRDLGEDTFAIFDAFPEGVFPRELSNSTVF